MAITFDSEATRRWRDGWRPSVWLFDFDGTLVDSVELILDSYRYATAAVLGETPAEDVLRGCIGRPLLDAMQTLDFERAARAHRRLPCPQRHPPRCSIGPLPRRGGAAGGLQADGRTIGIVTSKRRSAVDLALDMLGITTRFDVIVSWEDTDRHKPLPDPLLEALRRLDAAPADAIYLGDTAWDIRAARAAGVLTAAVLWGVAGADEMEAEQPDLTFGLPVEVLAG